MRVVDRSGRLFGKINVLDAVIIALVVLAVAAAYAAWLLLRTPAPTLIQLDPTLLPATAESRWLGITGTNLRPYFRAYFAGEHAAPDTRYLYEPFIVQSPTSARVRVRDDIKPGVYDLVISDESKVLVRMPKALTIPAPPQPASPIPVASPEPTQAEVRLNGVFIGIASNEINQFRRALEGAVEPWGRVLAVGRPQPDDVTVRTGLGPIAAAPVAAHQRLPAVLLVRCEVIEESCQIGGARVAAGSTAKIKVSEGVYDFLVYDMFSTRSVPVDLKASGAFVGFASNEIEALRRSATAAAGPWGRVLAVGAPESDDINVKARTGTVAAAVAGRQRLPAVLLVHCEIIDGTCRLGGGGLSAGATVKVALSGGAHDFLVYELYGTTMTTLNVTLEVGAANPVWPVAQKEAAAAPTIEQMLGLVPRLVSVSNPSSRLLHAGTGGYGFDLMGTIFTAIVSVPAERSRGEWQFAGKSIRVGEAFAYSGRMVTISGLIVGVEQPPSGTARGQ